MAHECPKCHAERRYLFLQETVIETGEKIQAIVCRRCAHRLAERLTRVRMDFARAKKAGVGPDVARQIDGRNAPRPKDTLQPCSVPGCHRMHSGKTQWPLCFRHSHRIRVWLEGKRTRPCPVQCINGHWFTRDEALIPGDPGGLSASKAAHAPHYRARRISAEVTETQLKEAQR